MNLFKKKLGLAAVIISLGILLAVLWFCLFGFSRENTKDATLVWSAPCEKEVCLCLNQV